MRYEEIHRQCRNNYEALSKKLSALTDTPEYRLAVNDGVFDMIHVLALAKKIDVYAKADARTKPVFRFGSVQEALAVYEDVMHFTELSNDVLDRASLICDADAAAERINTYVSLSDYLDDSFLVKREDTVLQIAKDSLATLPVSRKEITPELRTALLRGMLLQFNCQQTVALAKKGVFVKTDIEDLIPNDQATKGYIQNFNILCKGFGYDSIPSGPLRQGSKA